MKKVTKVLQCLFLCGFMCTVAPQNARALFGLTPPLPFDIDIDVPDDAAKIVSILKAAYRKLQTIETAANSLNLESIKGGDLAAIAGGDLGKYIKGPKSPVKDPIEPYGSIEKNEVREDPFYDTFKELFFTAPGGQEARLAYRKKAIEFKQDMIIDAYVAGRITEDYLILVEKTIKRLDECQQGVKTGGDCTFFGLQWSDIKSMKDAPENEDNPGQMGEARNAYIVITVYDRLMRIVEDLAATEAMFQAARSIDLAKPVEGSDASQYINKKFHFAHHQAHETMYADVSGLNDKADIKNIQIAKILNKLQQIDTWQQGAMAMHNLKVKLPEYKAMYRKYLKAKEVHERTMKALAECDECAKTFIDTYKGKKLRESWGDSKPVNDYASRTGISRELINEYEKAVETTIIETDNNLCPGYYYKGNCPAGYKEGETCKIITMVEVPDAATGNINVEEKVTEIPDYHECVMDKAQQDTDNNMNQEIVDDLEKMAGNEDELLGEDETDYLEDAVNSEEVRKDSRIKAERTWRVAEKKLMQLTEEEQLKFKPWNDQMAMQEQYLRQKYNNMKLIVLSVDDAVNTFKIAKDYVENHPEDIQKDLENNPDVKKAKKFVWAATRCKAAKDAVADAEAEWCGDACDGSCKITPSDDATGVIKGTKKVMQEHDITDDEGNVTGTEEKCDKEESKEWIQEVNLDGSNCAFTQEPQEIKPLATSGCPGTWNLTPEFLVTNYFKAVPKLGNCAVDTKKAAENMRTTAKDEYKRRVAQDLLRNIIQVREDQDDKMRRFVKDYETKLSAKKQKLMNLRTELGKVNIEINEASTIKNNFTQEKKRGDLRVEAIKNEIDNLKQQLTINVGQKTIDVRTGKEKPDYKQQCSLEVQIYKLEYEGRIICKNADTGKHEHCVYFAPELEPWGDGSDGCQAVRQEEAEYLAEGEEPYREDIDTIEKLKAEDFVRAPSEEEDTRQVNLAESDLIIEQQETKLVSLRARRDAVNEQIKSLDADIKEAAKVFAKAYIELAIEHQRNLDEKNASFERYLEDEVDVKHRRMQRGTKSVCTRIPPFIGDKKCVEIAEDIFEKDNLESTLKNILYRNQSELPGKEEIIWTGFDEAWNINDPSKLKKAILALGVHEEFRAGASMEGVNTAEKLAVKVRDLMAVAATEKLNEYITEIDEKVKDEREDAQKLIEERAKDLGVCKDCTPSDYQLMFLSNHGNYADNGDITVKHQELLKELRKPKHLTGKYAVENLNDFFGIPTDEELYTKPACDLDFRDDKFFVALPARGNNYIDKPEDDVNAGRDFRSPSVPLLNLPPLREVFYFSSADYEDMPREDDGTPSWTTFLNKKFVSGGWNDYPQKPVISDEVASWEYLPRTWLHILARPNMRNDGLYQQTFVERPFGDGAIGNILDKPGNYSVHIARAGVYPCQLGSNIVDIAMGKTRINGLFEFTFNVITEAKFVRGNGIVEKTPKCREIAENTDKSTPCGIYNKGRGGICHLLADHGMKNKDGDRIEDSENLGLTKSEAYEKHSELGNLFEFRDNKIYYRQMQESIHQFLMNEDEAEERDNDITYQKANRAVYTHSIFSTFLDAVNTEHNALKNLENTRQSLEDAMLNLCQQIHAQGKMVGDYGDGFSEELLQDPQKCDRDCQEAFNQKCVALIIDGAGLATSADEDKKYGANGEYTNADFNGISCSDDNKDGSFYEELFCKLDELKDELIKKSHEGEKSDPIINERGEPENDLKVGMDNIGDAAAEAERDAPFEVVTDTAKVKERWQMIKNYDAAFKADPNEEVFLSPTLSTMDNEEAAAKAVTDELNQAKANRTAAREGDEDAIKSMGNQSQIVPYCPLYMNNQQIGL